MAAGGDQPAKQTGVQIKMKTATTILSRARLLAISFGLLAAVVLFTSGCQTAPKNSLATHNSTKWENAIATYEASDKTNPPPKHPIVFIGSSSILKWKSLAADFPNLPVINRGFGGSQLADSVNFADRIVIPYAPREVVVYAGGNDINANKSPEIVYGDFVALMQKLHAGLPHARLAYISIAPNLARWAQVEKVRRLNVLAENYCRRHDIAFINVFPLMLGLDGQPKPDIYVADGLHMNARGYAIWQPAVAPYLK
jgi:lysophospholipase L1-like esterase